VAEVVERLSSKHEVLNSNPSTKSKKKKNKLLFSKGSALGIYTKKVWKQD
jgi:hypothetical protein